MHIDGVTYRLRRREFKTGRVGFLLTTGAVVHGRPSWVQAMVLDNLPLEGEARIRKTTINRVRHKYQKKALRAQKAQR